MSLSKLFPCFQFRLEDNVKKIDYSNNILSNGFPEVWQHERTLEELNITSTRINYLPPQLFYCQSLKILFANNNNLESIPDAIGSLRQLQQLNISRNFISNVPNSIRSCKNLTHLDLSCNTLQKLPDAITCLISLQELILNETYLEFLPANFGRLVNLRTVELRSNNLISLPKSMQRLANLQRLDIGCNEFTKIPEVIGELKQLREFLFDFNQIQNMPSQVGKLRDLVHLEANGNCLRYLPNEIGNWRNLEVFSTSLNNLSTFPFSVGMLKSLVKLKCESNELTELPGSISNLENLEELDVSHNKLVRLPNSIGMLRKLRYLFADDNNLQKLPEEICSCSVLSILSVSRNKISDLPDNIGHLVNLRVLNIVQNCVSTLPVTILSLLNLNSLWISNNQSQPLIPLQYTDVLKKTQLTCFMLPQQLSTKQSEPKLNNSTSTEISNDEQIDSLSDEAACINSKRRICFAEEATILQSYPDISHLSLSTSRNKICNNGNRVVSLLYSTSPLDPPVSPSTTNSYENSNLMPIINSKDFLMRSPTPYPKELRSMAKFVQMNHGKPLNICNKENDVNFYEGNRCSNVSTLLLQSDGECGSYNKSLEQQRANTVDDRKEHNFAIGNNNSNLKSYLQQCQQSHSVELEENTGLTTYRHQQFDIADNTTKPPPYHIARCFTKKTVEDLTKYEFVRKRKEQNQNFQNTNIDNNQKILTDVDSQNNLIIQQFSQDDFMPSKTEVIGSETLVTKEKKDFLETSNSQIFNINSNRKCNKSKNKWLFGAHRNPRVMQINVNCENRRDFAINNLPNREGIFVISTVSESYASQLIQPFDKLLEVDGIDFTNININEARHVLENSRSSISILLSRK